MTVQVDILITAPIQLGDLSAVLKLSDGTTQRLVLRAGRFVGELPKAPVWLQVTEDAAPADQPPLRPEQDEEGAPGQVPPTGEVVSFEELFESGVALHQLTVRLQLVWGLHCHQAGVIAPVTTVKQASTGDRFSTWEHIQCAEQVGKDVGGGPLRLGNRRLGISYRTELAVGIHKLTFGQIIALAGDYYAFLDDTAAQDREASQAWPRPGLLNRMTQGDYTRPTLTAEDPDVVRDVLGVADRDRNIELSTAKEAARLTQDGLFGRYPVRRFLALASQNYCHFATPPGATLDQDIGALRWYRYYHQRALAAATKAGEQADRDALLQALVIDAFGCHFLTDLFATGHMRVPRYVLGKLGLWRGSLGLAHKMHCEDNMLGLWCTTQMPQTPRRVWLAFGDAQLLTDMSYEHKQVVQEAVRRSVHELVACYNGQPLLPESRAEALLPVPLPPGESPTEKDVMPLRADQPTLQLYKQSGPNHYPLVCYVPAETLLVKRRGSADVNVYLDVDEQRPELFSVEFPQGIPAIGAERYPRLT